MKLTISVLLVVGVLSSVEPAGIIQIETNDAIQEQVDAEAWNSLIGPKVVNGLPAKAGQIPYQVGIRTLLKPFICGGSLISDQWVLTASHCVVLTGLVYFVSYGNTVWNNGFTFDGNTQVVLRIVVHPKYNIFSKENDIALLKLLRPVQFSDTVRPVALPALSGASQDFTGQSARVSGWGITNFPGPSSKYLMFADQTAISEEKCGEYFRGYSYPQHICALGENGQGACNGDSGGPLVIQTGAPVQIGIVKAGRTDCDPSYPSIYTRVTPYLQWISKVTGITI